MGATGRSGFRVHSTLGHQNRLTGLAPAHAYEGGGEAGRTASPDSSGRGVLLAFGRIARGGEEGAPRRAAGRGAGSEVRGADGADGQVPGAGVHFSFAVGASSLRRPSWFDASPFATWRSWGVTSLFERYRKTLFAKRTRAGVEGECAVRAM